MKIGMGMCRKAQIVGLAGLLGMSLGACNSESAKSAGSVFRTSYSGVFKSLDSVNAYENVGTLEVGSMIFESPYQFKLQDGRYEIEPLLAEKMPEVSTDQLTMTFTLKPGVRFQDDPCFEGGKGREIRAADVVYAMKRIADPRTQSELWWTLDGKVRGLNELHDELIKHTLTPAELYARKVDGLEALDQGNEHRVRIRFTKPDPQFLSQLTFHGFAPTALEAVTRYANETGVALEHPVGTGPYRLEEWKREQRLVLTQNETYREPARVQQPSRIEFHTIKEAQTTWLKFLKGELDAINVPKDLLQKVLSEPKIRTTSEASSMIMYLNMNTSPRSVLHDVRLRQAISSAIDRSTWMELFAPKISTKADFTLPPGVPDRPKSGRLAYDFDLERAERLLKETGHPHGQGLPELIFNTYAMSTQERQMGELLVAQLARVGLRVKVNLLPFPKYIEAINQDSYDLAEGGWILDYPDPENLYQTLYSKNLPPAPNATRFSNPEFDRLYETLARMPAGPARQELIQKMEAIVQEESPWALLYYTGYVYAYQPWVKDLIPNIMLTNRLKYVRISDAR